MTLCRNLLSLIAMGLLIDASQSFRYNVGDSVWSIPPYPDFYTNWSYSIVFYLGDSIVFYFEPEFFNVLQVPLLDYEGCTSSNAVKLLTHSPAIIVLNEVGVFYYICNISNYCDLGQKISVVVHPHSPHLPPSPSPSPSPLLSSPPSVPFSPPSELPPSESLAPGRSVLTPSPAMLGDAPTPSFGKNVGKNIGATRNYYKGFRWAYSVLFWSVFLGF